MNNEAGPDGSHIVDAVNTITAKNALKALKPKGLGSKNKKVDLAGQELNPEKAYANLQEALKLVKENFGKTLKIDLNDIQFRQFHGNMVGESTEKGTYIDPVMLMHPALRLAHVIAHELAHKNKKITNEAVVEGFVHLFFGNDGAEHVYEKAVENFGEFARRFDKNGDVKAGTEKIYELYYKGKFEKIYQRYDKNYMSGLGTDTEKEEAFGFFKEVFPELDYAVKEDKAGYFDMKKLPEGEVEAGSVGEEVVSLAANKVKDTEEQIRSRERVDL